MKRVLLVLTTAALALTSTLAPTLASAQPWGRDDRRGGWDNNRWDRDDRRGGPRWERGQRLPPQFRGRDRYVSDWGRYRLSAPPRGYGYYRQDNGDFVLAAIATGLIASLISGNQIGGNVYGGGYGYAQPYVAGPQVFRDAYGRAYTVDRYGRSVWVR